MKRTAVPNRQDQCGSIGDFGLQVPRNRKNCQNIKNYLAKI